MNGLFKIVSVSEYRGLSRTGKPYTLNTLEIDYNGEKAKIKTFEEDAKPGDYAKIGIGTKKSIYGAELIVVIDEIVSGQEEQKC